MLNMVKYIILHYKGECFPMHKPKHQKKRNANSSRKEDIFVLTIGIIFSFWFVGNVNIPDKVEETISNQSSGLTMKNPKMILSEIQVPAQPQVEVETYEDLANDPEVLALIQEELEKGEQLVGTAATIAAELQYVEMPSETSVSEGSGDEWDALVKATGDSQLWEDYQLLCRITWAEAGNQTMVQRQAVASVILNRVGTQGFGQTLKEVVFQKGQFSTAQNGQVIDWTGNVVEFSNVDATTKEAVYRALVIREDPTEQWLLEESNSLGLDSEKYAEGGALYFFASYLKGKEAQIRQSISCSVKEGTHIFYKIWG